MLGSKIYHYDLTKKKRQFNLAAKCLHVTSYVDLSALMNVVG